MTISAFCLTLSHQKSSSSMILSYKLDYRDGFICTELLLMEKLPGFEAGFEHFET